MSFINFTEEEKVDVISIDTQHEHIVDLINELFSRIGAGNKPAVAESLNYLIEILESHFETEERFMKETHFPGYISHKLEHDRFYNQIVGLADKYRKGEINFGVENLESIRRWFFNHLEINDKKCGVYLKSKGIN